MPNPDEAWQKRSATFQHFEKVTRESEVRDDKIQLRLQQIRDFVTQTQHLPGGALIRVGAREQAAKTAINAILATSTIEVPFHSENPHSGEHAGWLMHNSEEAQG